MAKFISLPFGVYNPETNKDERTEMLVNLDRIITITPFEQFMCKVTLAGGKVVGVYRRYDTLKAQITNKEDLTGTYPEEEVTAAYAEGYNKGIKECGATREKIAKEITEKTIEWLETNPLRDGWRKELKKYVMKED